MSEISTPQPHSIENPDEAQMVFFIGDNEYWRLFRQEEYGESNRALVVMPMMKDGVKHDVGWLERAWTDSNTDESRIAHHAACRCMTEAELRHEDPFAAMENCNAWQAGVLYRALEINHQDSVDFGKMIALSAQLTDSKLEEAGLPELALDPVDEALMHHLRVVKTRPYYWEGNVRAGEHKLHLLSVVTGYDAGQLTEHAHLLAENGWIQFEDDQTIRLAA